MSITRLVDTFTLRSEDGTVYDNVTRIGGNKVALGAQIYTDREALELALALVSAATGTVVRKAIGKGKVYNMTCGGSSVTVNCDDPELHEGYYSAWAVADLMTILGNEAFHGMTGETRESLTRKFSFLSDDQAREITEHFASLVA